MLSGITPMHTSIIIHETFVNTGVPWTDWHEELDPGTPPGWMWSPMASIPTPGGPLVPGLVVSLDPSGRVIWFDFDPLVSPIEIWKELVCESGTGCGGSIGIIEFPTVPIPAAAWLFGSALLGLVAAKRKKA
jgi:hypothetical protein